MTPLKCFFVGTFLLCYVFQHYAYGQNSAAKKAEKYSERYARIEMDEFLKFLNQSNDSSTSDQVIEFLEACEKELAGTRCISYRVPIGEHPYLWSERNWISQRHTVLFYFPIQVTSSTTASLQDKRGGVIDPSVLEEQNPIYPSLTIRGEKISFDKATLGMFFIALKAINNRYNRPRFNIRILIDTQVKGDHDRIKKLGRKYGDDLRADLIFIFNGGREVNKAPLLEIPSTLISNDRIVNLKENLKEILGSPIEVTAPQTNPTESIKYLSGNFDTPIVSIPIFEQEAIEKNELSFSQFKEGIKSFIAVLQTQF